MRTGARSGRAPGSARRIMSDLTIVGTRSPPGRWPRSPRCAAPCGTWQVNEVVIDGESRDPVYCVGVPHEVLGDAPRYVHGAWVWRDPGRRTCARRPITGASLLAVPTGGASRPHPLADRRAACSGVRCQARARPAA